VVLWGFAGLAELEHVQAIYTILGNHDLIDKTGAIHSQVIFEGMPKVEVFEQATMTGKVAFLPYTSTDPLYDLAELERMHGKPHVIYAHHPINGGLLRKGLRDHGRKVNESDYDKYSAVVMGHYHHPENRGKVIYVGSPSMHDWSDVEVEIPRGVAMVEVTDNVHIERYANPYCLTFASFLLVQNPPADEMQQLTALLSNPGKTLLRLNYDPSRAKDAELLKAKLKPQLKALYTKQLGTWSEAPEEPLAQPQGMDEPTEVVKRWVREHPPEAGLTGVEDIGVQLLEEQK
jgi:hypothetical protein